MKELDEGRFVPYLALGASAGSGKTFALTVRYCALLFMGVASHKIVALTFTNKAAAQMQQRIMQTLEGVMTPKYESERKEILRQTGLTLQELEERAVMTFEKFVSGSIRIMTIDKFLHGVLRHFSLYAGVMPDFTVGNQSEKKILSTFLKGVEEKGLIEPLLYLYRHEAKKGASVLGLLNALYAKGVKQNGEQLDITQALHAKEELETQVMEATRELAGIVVSHESASATAKRAIVANDIYDLVGKSWLEKESLNYSTYTKCWSPKMDELLEVIKEGVRVWFALRERIFLKNIDLLYGEYIFALKKLAKESNMLSFSDVATRVSELLSDEGVVGNDFLYFRLDGALDHILIDEFQDTSMMQYTIFAPLIAEVVGSFEGLRSFFCVGDPKQSIYRFRGAISTLFRYVKTTYDLEWRTLETNYRSCEKIVSFVNTTFQKHYPDFVPSLSIKEGGCVKVATGEPLALIVENLLALRAQGVSDDEMAILCYTNDDVLRIEKALKEADPTLHTVTETSSKLINHPKIRPLIAWLEYALKPSELARGNFLSLIGREYDETIDLKALESFNPLHVAMSLKGVIDHYHLFDGDENTIRFIEMGYKAKSVEEFLENLKTYDDAVVSGSLSGVRILTIHKSKGLEFEHVMVCDLLSKQNAQHDTLFFVPYDEVHEELRAYFGKRQNVDPAFQKVCEESDKLSREDRLNGLYVAFTRGKESLFVAKREAQSAFEMLDLCEGTTGEIPWREIQSVQTPKQEKTFYYQPLSLGHQEDILGFDEESDEKDYQAIAWGEAIHYALELTAPHTKKETILQSVHSRFGWIIGHKQSIIADMIEGYQNNDFIISLYKGEVHKEQPLVSDGKVFVIDFYSVFEDKVVVLDYKTGGKKGEYHIQVANYMALLKNIYHRPIEGYICYIQPSGLNLNLVDKTLN